MAGASQGLHEPEARLGDDVVDVHRAVASIQEELKTYLFTEGSITDIEHAAEAD